MLHRTTFFTVDRFERADCSCCVPSARKTRFSVEMYFSMSRIRRSADLTFAFLSATEEVRTAPLLVSINHLLVMVTSRPNMRCRAVSTFEESNRSSWSPDITVTI